MSLTEKIDKRLVIVLEGENKESICKDLKEKVMKQLSPEIMSSVNKMLVLNLAKWKEDFVKPLIKDTVKEVMAEKNGD
ncbi:unnamed protein product [marine sediment metagenome]|uniref:Uncharacterized protein n=1 Tax=marine sediment metagenome TaxID=412755 RepID=X0U8U9_9ZZZZ